MTIETPPSADARRDAAAALTAVPVDLWAEDLRWRHPVDLWADLAPTYPRVDPRRLLEDAATDGWWFLLPGDPQWPAALTRDLRPGPVGLWVRGFGDLSVLADRSVTITGNRTSTGYGTQVAADLAAALAPRWVDRPVTIAAAGTGDGADAAALRAAAATGTAIAVLATTSELTG
ncbi:DNA recombination-mediator protein A [Parafrankia irregularis]|uniref:DNA recombination-mediator protein A n=1 Tax=Parafrankia irregularis TaxID=795642 RepID=A0A0S4R0Y7_9ACTN|nr:DNA-processing protein DprA [Parafrankia sp. CH37]CUU60876.1 DNA recombination-mediator protein A [Parafrankia irregularis]